MDIINALPGSISYGLIWGLMAIGVFITYKILDFADLSVDGSICTGMAVCTMLVINGCNVIIAMLIAFLVGALCGLMTGLFHTFMGIPPILSGILTQLMLWSINLKILGSKANVSLPSRQFDVLVSSTNNVGTIVVVCAIIVIVITLLFLFFQTEIGYAIRSTGSNIDMSRTLGINTKLTKILGLMLSNGIVALAGALLAQYQGFADINSGRGAIVIGLAALIIGEALVKKFKNNIVINLIGIMFGGIIYYLVFNIIIILGFDTDLLKMLSALLVGIFLAIPYWKNNYAKKRKKVVIDVKD
jgi:putative ABC transport system permease protein